MSFILGFIAGAVALFAYQVCVEKKRSQSTWAKAVIVVASGGGPRPGTPK